MNFTSHPRRFLAVFPLFFPPPPSLTHSILLRCLHPLFCLNPYRTASSFPVFEFEFPTLRWRYVAIMALHTQLPPYWATFPRESWSFTNEHSSMLRSVFGTVCSPVQNPETRKEDRPRPNLWYSGRFAARRHILAKSKSARPSLYHLRSLDGELLVKIVFKRLIPTCACETSRSLRARRYVFQDDNVEIVTHQISWHVNSNNSFKHSTLCMNNMLVFKHFLISSRNHGTREELSKIK